MKNLSIFENIGIERLETGANGDEFRETALGDSTGIISKIEVL